MSIDGRYKVRAVPGTLEIGAFSESGSEGLSLTLVIDDPEHPDMAGTMCTWFGWLSEKALPRAVKTLQKLGWTGGRNGDDLSDQTGLGSETVTAVFSMKEEEGRDGNKYTKQDIYIPLPEDSVRSFRHKADLGARARQLASAVGPIARGEQYAQQPSRIPPSVATQYQTQAPRKPTPFGPIGGPPAGGYPENKEDDFPF